MDMEGIDYWIYDVSNYKEYFKKHSILLILSLNVVLSPSDHLQTAYNIYSFPDHR
jgi:hypothetical protein